MRVITNPMFKNSKLLKILGPGLITGASDDDPSGIITYLQAGVILGFRSLWSALLTLPLMYAIQEMCGRLGMVTGHGLLRLLKNNYPKLLVYIIALAAGSAMIINLGADLLAIGVVMEKLTGFTRLFWLVAAAGLILFLLFKFSYHKIAHVLKWLTLSLFAYVATVFAIKINWFETLGQTFTPALPDTLMGWLIISAILGTTISPYLFFWQAGEEAEEKKFKRITVTKHELKNLHEDTFLGMLFSNTVMWFILVGAAHLAQNEGLTLITNFDQAALVLEPLLGSAAYLMFALGIIGTGLLAIPVLAGATGYIAAELFNWPEGLGKPYRRTRGFHFTIIIATILGILLTLLGFDPVDLLIKTAIIYAILTPILIFLIIRLSNNKKIMGDKTTQPIINILGYLALLIILGVLLVPLIFY